MPVSESTWPRMTAGPRWPGAGPCSYQPVRLWSPSGGTWTVPSAFSPTLITGALTSMSGMLMLTGADLASGLARGSWVRLGGTVVTDAGVNVAPASAGGEQAEAGGRERGRGAARDQREVTAATADAAAATGVGAARRSRRRARADRNRWGGR